MTEKLIRIGNDGREEVYYSEEYLNQQIRLAHSAGVTYGLRVEMHAIQPMSGYAVDDLTEEFYKKVRETYDQMYRDFHLKMEYTTDFHRKMINPTYKSKFDG